MSLELQSRFGELALLIVPCIALVGNAAFAAELPHGTRTYAGKIPNPNDNDDVGKFTKVLGHHGCLLIRSKWRYDDALAQFAGLGWKPPAAAPLGEVDFSKQMIVCVFDCGDESHAFAVRGIKLAGERVELDLLMNFVVYKARDRVRNNCKFFLATTPLASAATISIATYYDGDPAAEQTTPEKAKLEWSALLGGPGGDVVDGLRGKIEPERRRIKPGDDVRMRFTLELVDPMAAKHGQFSQRCPRLAVWDGKYSEGYRNHPFEVRGPDGKTVFLQPKVIGAWDKNVPHLVPITAGAPYVLPCWVEGEHYKSLRELGLDTTKPGSYTITGIYTESGSTSIDPKSAVAAEPVMTWGGRIATNSVTVEVAK